jgi:hypothetical protein
MTLYKMGLYAAFLLHPVSNLRADKRTLKTDVKEPNYT